MYTVTARGKEYLAAWINDLRCTRDEIGQIIEASTRQHAGRGAAGPAREAVEAWATRLGAARIRPTCPSAEQELAELKAQPGWLGGQLAAIQKRIEDFEGRGPSGASS